MQLKLLNWNGETLETSWIWKNLSMLSLDETLTWAAMEAICSQLIMILTTLRVMDSFSFD